MSSRQPKKILLVHNAYRKPSGEKSAIDAQVIALKAAGYQVVEYRRSSAEFDHWPLMQKIASIALALFSLQTMREVEALIEKERPNLVYVHNIFPLISPSVYFAVSKHKLPIIQFLHNYRYIEVNLNRVVGLAIKRQWSELLYLMVIAMHALAGTFKRIAVIVVASQYMANKITDSYLSTGLQIPVQVIEYPISIPRQIPSQKKAVASATGHILYLGRMTEEKGVLTLLSAAAAFPKQTFLLVGDVFSAKIADAVRQTTQTNSHIQFLPRVSGVKKWQLLKQAKLLVMPSEWEEPFGLSAAEAMLVGTPVIAANTGGLAGLIQHEKTGLVFKPGDTQDLQQQLQCALDNSKKMAMMARSARKQARTRFNSQVFVGKFDTLYATYAKAV